MTTLVLLLGVVAGLVLSAFVSGVETGVYCLNPVRLRVAAEQGDPAARRLERLMRRPENLVITMLLGTNLADYFTTACVAALLLRAGTAANLTEVYATAIVTPLILVFGGIIPKDWFRREANRLLLHASWLVLVLVQAAQATGLVWLLRTLSHALVRRVDPQRAGVQIDLLPRARALHLLREGVARGELTNLQRDLIERVLNLSDVRVTDVMIPRSRSAVAAVDLPRDEFLRIARMAHFSRLPVYRSNPRQIVGIVNVYDVLTDPARKPVAEHVRPPLALPENVSVSTALLRLQRARQTMAIVQDRANHCVGILTLKDLVEEIVGDLEVW
jgi:CBS domain containing-hemolysin-like protein